MVDRDWQPGDADRRAPARLAEVDREELREFLREAVVAGLRDHPCRFGDEGAKVLHQVTDAFDKDQITALSLMARAINGVGARIGQALVWGMFAAALGGVIWMSRHGMLPDL